MIKMLNQSRSLMICISIFCLTMLGIAVFLQQTMDMLPCPLCVLQRYIFLGIALICLLGVVVGLPKFGAFLALLGSIGGMYQAGQHVYILDHPGLSCGIDPLETALNKVITAEYLPFLFKADGLCEAAKAPFYGLALPEWSFIAFAICAIGLLWALTRRA